MKIQQYTDFVRQKALEELEKSGSVRKTAERAKISESTLRRWRAQAASTPKSPSDADDETPDTAADARQSDAAGTDPPKNRSSAAEKAAKNDEGDSPPSVDELIDGMRYAAGNLTDEFRKSVADAPLNQKATALGVVVDRLLRLMAHQMAGAGGGAQAVDHGNDGRPGIRYVYPEDSPPWETDRDPRLD